MTAPADSWACRFCGTSFDGCEQSPYPCCVGCLDTPNGGHLTEDGKAPSEEAS